jgi:hypothetical protein
MPHLRSSLIAAAAAGIVVATLPVAASSAPGFSGRVAKPAPIAVPPAPINRFMAPAGKSNIHNDTFMSDLYRWAGPVGKKMSVASKGAGGECASITFNQKGQIVAVCVLPFTSAFLTLMDPNTLKIITQAELPAPPDYPLSSNTSGGGFTDLAGGYFYLDNKGQAVVSTATQHLITYKPVTIRGITFFKVMYDVDLSSFIGSSADVIQSALPDSSGNIWFATKFGVVGVVNHAPAENQPLVQVTKMTGTVPNPLAGQDGQPAVLNEAIGNSFAMDQSGGVYIVSTQALYRYQSVGGTPTVTWRTTYDNTNMVKPGQKTPGSGTTPTVIPRNRVAIMDNSDPENIVVYDNATGAQVCKVPVFNKGASANENSLISVGNSLIAENNYGFANAVTDADKVVGGMARVDVASNGTCTPKWTNTSVVVPSVVSKASSRTGLIYTYSCRKSTRGWYWTAINFRTGKQVYSQLVGKGPRFNNSYASLYVAPNGDGFVGVIPGLVRVRDGR